MIRVDPDYEWMVDAACEGADPDVFFPGPHEPERLTEARAICARCPVLDACLDHARRHREKHGVWAGTSATERDEMRAGRRPWAPSLGKAEAPEPGDAVVELRRQQ